MMQVQSAITERDNEQRELFVAAAEMCGTAAPAAPKAPQQLRLKGMMKKAVVVGRLGGFAAAPSRASPTKPDL